MRTLASPRSLPISPARERVAPHGGAVLEHVDRGDLVVAQPLARAQRARAHADVGDLLPRLAALDLEHGGAQRAVGVRARGRQQLAHAGDQRVDAGARDRRAEVHRVHERLRGLRRQLAPQPRVRDLVLDVGGEERVVVVGQHVGLREPRLERRVARADAAHPAHRHDRGRQPLGDLVQHRLLARAGAIDLVDEQQRRDPQPLQRAHQHARLRLHALDGREHEHRAVEHVQDALHLGDEVGVPRRVDQVDRDVADDERHDRRLDRDPAPALERQRVGLRAAGVDASDLVDDTGAEEQPLRQARLTGVDMRQDS